MQLMTICGVDHIQKIFSENIKIVRQYDQKKMLKNQWEYTEMIKQLIYINIYYM